MQFSWELISKTGKNQKFSLIRQGVETISSAKKNTNRGYIDFSYFFNVLLSQKSSVGWDLSWKYDENHQNLPWCESKNREKNIKNLNLANLFFFLHQKYYEVKCLQKSQLPCLQLPRLTPRKIALGFSMVPSDVCIRII